MLLPQLWAFGSREFALSALKSHFFHVFLFQSSRMLFSLVFVSQELFLLPLLDLPWRMSTSSFFSSSLSEERPVAVLWGTELHALGCFGGTCRQEWLWGGTTVAVPCSTWDGCA